MDFIILKINGKDVTTCSHDEAVKYFNEAPDRFLVEIARKNNSIQLKESREIRYQLPLITEELKCGIESSPIKSSKNIRDASQSSRYSDTGLDNVKIVKLTKCTRDQSYGLTLSYELLQLEKEVETSVFISEIEKNSLASFNSNLRVGNEILAINDEPVKSRSQVIDLFRQSDLEVVLTVLQNSENQDQYFPEDYSNPSLGINNQLFFGLRETDILSSDNASSQSEDDKLFEIDVNSPVDREAIKSNMECIDKLMNNLSLTYSSLMSINISENAAVTMDLLKDMPCLKACSKINEIDEMEKDFDIHNLPKKCILNISESSLQKSSKNIDNNKLYENLPVTMEWVLKKRPDGSKYVTRRPKRNKFLKERAKQVVAERTGGTTDDDAHSEIKLGRYWSKSDRRKHLRKYRRFKSHQTNVIEKYTTKPTHDCHDITNKNSLCSNVSIF